MDREIGEVLARTFSDLEFSDFGKMVTMAKPVAELFQAFFFPFGLEVNRPVRFIPDKTGEFQFFGFPDRGRPEDY